MEKLNINSRNIESHRELIQELNETERDNNLVEESKYENLRENTNISMEDERLFGSYQNIQEINEINEIISNSETNSILKKQFQKNTIFKEPEDPSISKNNLQPFQNELKKLKSEEEIQEFNNILNLPDLESKTLGVEFLPILKDEGNEMSRNSDVPLIPLKIISPAPSNTLDMKDFKLTKFAPSSDKLITIEENKREEDFLFGEKSGNFSFEQPSEEKVKILAESKSPSKKQMRKIKSRKLRRRQKGIKNKVKANVTNLFPYTKK
mmetsp:Transcript_6597/g.5690  ORF Transcript_6597/g.5690 Transcript_6597/m.5690 type:complete len:266 (+) Transcript_6597:3-800(+)